MKVHRKFAEESGVALVVALVITLAVFALTELILLDAVHNLVGGVNARERLVAVNAAEAGVAWYSRTLESSSLTSLGSWSTKTGAVTGLPGKGTYTVTATYFLASDYDPSTLAIKATATPVTLSSYNSESVPSSLFVRVRSEGAACRDTASPCSATVTRVLEAIMEITPQKGAVKGAFAGIYICQLGNRFSITGSAADVYLVADPSNEQDAAANACPDGYSGGDILRVTSGQFTTTGNVYVLKGGVLLSNTSKIDGSLWAKGSITLGGGGYGAGVIGNIGVPPTPCTSQKTKPVLLCGNATSQTGTITVNETARVLGEATTCATCTVQDLTYLKITKTQAEGAFPATYPSDPTKAWPDISGSLATFLANPSDDLQHRTSVSCSGTPTELPAGTLYLRNNLAIISECGFTFSGRVEIRRAANAKPGMTPTLYLITYAPDSYDETKTYATCFPSGVATTKYDHSITQNFNATAIRLYLYSPCKVTFRNQVNITGQIVARTLYAQGQTSIATVDLSLGASGIQPGTVSSFASRVLTVLEVV